MAPRLDLTEFVKTDSNSSQKSECPFPGYHNPRNAGFRCRPASGGMGLIKGYGGETLHSGVSKTSKKRWPGLRQKMCSNLPRL
jgi:hypothetical protein